MALSVVPHSNGGYLIWTEVGALAGPYTSTITKTTPRPDGRFDITIEGPGLLNPLLLVVVSSAEADAFVQVLNFAYTQGVLSQQRKCKKKGGGK